MAKPKALELTADDLIPPDAGTKRRRASSASRTRADETPAEDLVPLQFKMPREFVRAFKAEALKRDMKLNALLKACFEDFRKS